MSKQVRYGIWCAPQDGSENGKWFKYGGAPWLFFLAMEASAKVAMMMGTPRWHYETREYHE